MAGREYSYHFGCPVEATLVVIGGRWKGIILFHLIGGKRRYNELRRLVVKITHRMLTLQLKELERDGVIVRTAYPEMPPRVEYELSPLGESLRPIVLLMREWGVEYMDTVLKSRQIAA